MSSLAASRADGYYFPPDYDPQKHGSLNQFRGQHPLRERAKKLDQGILVIRFEMPFNVWCGGCNHLIGKGVRFNAEKKQIGNYHSTKIWSFTMRTPCCSHEIEVQTDPKNTEYMVVRGGRRKAETWTAENAETLELPDGDEEVVRHRDDPFTKLERGETDKHKGRALGARIAELYHDSHQKFRDDYTLNKTLRRQNRALRKQEKERDAKRKSLGLSDDVSLLPESEEDSLAASLVQFGDPQAFTKKWQQKRRAVKRQSIFAPSALIKKPRTGAGGLDSEAGGSSARDSAPDSEGAAVELPGSTRSCAAFGSLVPSQPASDGRQSSEEGEEKRIDAQSRVGHLREERSLGERERESSSRGAAVGLHRKHFAEPASRKPAAKARPPLRQGRKSIAEKAAWAAKMQGAQRLKFSA